MFNKLSTAYHSCTHLCTIAVLLAAASIPSSSQVTTATLYGSVADQSGAVVPGAVVTLIQEETSATVSRPADGQGSLRSTSSASAPTEYPSRLQVSNASRRRGWI